MLPLSASVTEWFCRINCSQTKWQECGQKATRSRAQVLALPLSVQAHELMSIRYPT
jgi:hypothetical protein